MAFQLVFFTVDLASWVSVIDVCYVEETCSGVRSDMRRQWNGVYGCCIARRDTFRILTGFKLAMSRIRDDFLLSAETWVGTMQALDDELDNPSLNAHTLRQAIVDQQLEHTNFNRSCLALFFDYDTAYRHAFNALHWLTDLRQTLADSNSFTAIDMLLPDRSWQFFHSHMQRSVSLLDDVLSVV